ncbi:MAG: hypothetical protein AB7W59_02305 [Acidimicrobiia bacterium]
MQQVDDPARFALAATDATIDGKAVDGKAVDVLRENDFAVAKARADVIVEGHLTGAHGGRVTVDDRPWLSREMNAKAASVGADTARNLFGWHQRTEPGRYPDEGTEPLPKQLYAPMLNNVYRRTPGFFDLGIQAELPPGALVRVYQSPVGSGEAYAFHLPSTRYEARLRSAGADCPDQPRRWAIVKVLPMRADTLIVRPGADEAELIWRANWWLDDIDQTGLRVVQIVEAEGGT